MDDAEAYEFYADPANRVMTGPGRKRSGQRLTRMSSIRFTPEVIEQVKDLAGREGITVGAWIRRLVQWEINAGAAPKALGSSLPVLQPRTFSCPHLSAGNVMSATCGICGPLAAAA